MTTFGRQLLGNTGNQIQLTTDGVPEWKTGGVTIDWSTVTAVSSDTVVAEGYTVKNGQKYIKFGTPLTKITASGKFGPADTTASDGRQLLVRGEIFLLNESITEISPLGLNVTPTDHPGVIEGGSVWFDRLNLGYTNAPTLANVLAALPRLRLVKN